MSPHSGRTSHREIYLANGQDGIELNEIFAVSREILFSIMRIRRTVTKYMTLANMRKLQITII